MTVTSPTGRMCALVRKKRLPSSSVMMKPASGSSTMSATAIFMYWVPSTSAPAYPFSSSYWSVCTVRRLR